MLRSVKCGGILVGAAAVAGLVGLTSFIASLINSPNPRG